MKTVYAKGKTKGYTLGEVLVTVAIIVILAAIAVPAIFTIRKNMRQKALDNKAEIIYTAVQNNLTKLYSSGNSSKYAEDKATAVDPTPMDSDGDKALYYVTASDKENEDNAAYVVVTEDTVDSDLYNNYWVVEYDPGSASVYAVFYSESRDDYTPSTYNQLRYKKNRLKDGAKVGYYGGDSIESGDTTALVPKITVKNDEKLQVVISSKRPDDNPLSFDVELSDTEGHKLTLKYGTDSTGKNLVHKKDALHLADSGTLDANESGQIRGNNHTLTLTLDALDTDTDDKIATRFAELYGNATENSSLKNNPSQQLTAGTQLTIKVTVHSSNSMVDGLSATATTNSLFGDNSTSTEAEILYGRHLQNLDQDSEVTASITSAVQRSDIHFEEEKNAESGEDTSSWFSTYGTLAFHPITNKNLTSYHGEISSSGGTESDADSTSRVISHLTTENSEKAGLFAETADKMKISDVALSGATINGATAADSANKSYAGAFVAYADGSLTLENCQVYLDTSDVKGKTDDDLWMKNANIMGGLAGYVKGSVTVKNSFAATVMGGDNVSLAGGLIGEAKGGAKITTSYADSYISGDKTGGLIAKADDTTTVTGSYSVGYLKAEETAGGFVADGSGNVSLKDSYTAVSWLNAEKSEGTGTITRYSTIPSGSKKTVTNVYFLTGGTDYNSDDSTQNSAVGEKIDYSSLSNITKMSAKLNKSGTYFAGASVTNAYNLREQGLAGYSYPAISGLPHYGDWQASFEAGSLVYYEIYQSGTKTECGFYGGNITPSLKSDAQVVGDGYGVVYDENEKPTETFSVSYQVVNESGETETKYVNIDPTAKTTTYYKVTVGEQNYLVYPLPSNVVNAEPVDNDYYQKVVIRGNAVNDASDAESADGNVFYYNPHFAKTVVSVAGDGQKVETPKTIYVRTPRQLYALSKYYASYADATEKSTFTQELDLHYSSYEWTTYANENGTIAVQAPIGATTAFKAKYDGGCHTIDGISFAGNTARIGLFGENTGTIQNVFLVSDYQKNGSNPYLEYTGEIRSNKTVYMGTLAGINRGQINNCAVSGFYTAGSENTMYVRQNGTLYFGGLVGSNTGTIRNSEVDTPLANANILYGKAYIGGFAGENTSTGSIKDCYSVGKLQVEYSKGETSVMAGFTARNAGVLNADYCAVTLTSAGSTETYAFTQKGGNISSTCYYLGGGTFRYLGSMEAFDNTSGSGTMKTYSEMRQDTSSEALCHSATDSDSGYPFRTVVTDANGQFVHFGNWQIASNLGSFGVLYWEKEESGSNNGYHFSYIGYEQNANGDLIESSGDTLCEEHDDGGIVTSYGYAYYYSSDMSQAPEVSADGFQTGNENETVSKALSSRLDGFEVVAYTTAPAIGTTADATTAYMKMTSEDENGVWTLTDKIANKTYSFTINPFFANAMQYGTKDDGLGLAMPGEDGNKYEIRSAQQLQYMNWNNKTGDAVTSLDASNYLKYVNHYTYLGQILYSETGADKTETEYIWTGSEAPAKQKYVLKNDTTCGYDTSAYLNVTENSTNYWEFVEDAGSGLSYTVRNWTEEYKNWGIGHRTYHTHYTYTESTKTGYWKWVGSGAPTDDTSTWKKKGGMITDGELSFVQSHDVDANMTPKGSKLFTQIGSLYDTKAVDNVGDAYVYVTYFAGTYNGQAYSIKNVEINSSSTLVGLFGSIIGAEVKNITLYSENGNYIQRTGSTWSTKSWYAIGGLCGLAATGTGSNANDSVISNCTVSGYIIRDNSQYSSWGDGNVGGMLGISTMDITQCTAVNTIELNSQFTSSNQKSDGVSVRTGGLVGSMRGNLTNSYTGGEIKITDQCYNTARYGSNNPYGAKIFLGGLTGGIYLKNGGNLGSILGSNIQGLSSWTWDTSNGVCNTPTQTVKDCYTYIKLPTEKYDRIYSISPIGSNGETPNENTNNHHVRVKIENCYYYKDNIPRTKNFTTGDAGAGNSATNIDTTPVGLTLEQMQTTLFDKLSSAGFRAVTSSENGQSVDGKYSFPGNNKSLDGENYPFPTILQQTTSRGDTVYVHYGEWPNNEIYWEESRANMDIFESLNLEEGTDKGKALKTFVLKDGNGVLGTNKKTDDFSVFYNAGEESENSGSSDSGKTVAEINNIYYDSSKGGYVATVWAHKTGTETITVSAGGYSATFTLTVTADLTAYASQKTVNVSKNDKVSLQLYAVSTNLYTAGGTDTSGSETGTLSAPETDLAPYMAWNIEMETGGEDFLELSAIRENASKAKEFTISCLDDLPKDTTITLTITGTYAYENVDYTTTTWVEVQSTQAGSGQTGKLATEGSSQNSNKLNAQGSNAGTAGLEESNNDSTAANDNGSNDSATNGSNKNTSGSGNTESNQNSTGSGNTGSDTNSTDSNTTESEIKSEDMKTVESKESSTDSTASEVKKTSSSEKAGNVLSAGGKIKGFFFQSGWKMPFLKNTVLKGFSQWLFGA